MSRKYLIGFMALALVICVSLSPVFAGDDTYSVNVEGIDFNMPNNYQLDEEFVFEDDTTTQDRWGNDVPVHYKSEYYTDGKNTITITVSTSYDKPFEVEDVVHGSDSTKIAKKTGSLSKSPNDVAFWYVEDGKIDSVETLMEKNNEKIIKKVIDT